MPDLELIQGYKNRIDKLASEPAILADKGLEIEDIEMPSQDDLLDDLGGLLDDDFDAPAAEVDLGEEESVDDLLSNYEAHDSSDSTDEGSDSDIDGSEDAETFEADDLLGGLDADNEVWTGEEPESDDSFSLDSFSLDDSSDEASVDDLDLGLGDDLPADAVDDLDLGLGDDLSADAVDDLDLGLGDDLPADAVDDLDLGLGDDLSADVVDGLDFDDNSDSGFDSGLDLDLGGESFNDTDDLLSDSTEEPAEQVTEIEMGPGDEDSESFDLGDFGKGFDNNTDNIGNIELSLGLDESDEEEAVAGNVFSLDERTYQKIIQALNKLPLNLKVAIEEEIAEKGLEGEALQEVIAMLIGTASMNKLADKVSTISGRRIKVPRLFAKQTGEAYEKRQGSFWVVFYRRIWPKMRMAMAVFAALAVVFALAYTFLFLPFRSGTLFRKGLAAIEEDNYSLAEEYFQLAYLGRQVGLPMALDYDRDKELHLKGWRNKKWFFLYADAYLQKRQFELAASKYDQLLLWPWRQQEIGSSFHLNKKGVLAYALLEKDYRVNYEKATDILNYYLDRENSEDYDVLMLLGDIYLDWAMEDPEFFEKARVAYITIIDKHGGRNEILQHMLRYWVRRDQYGPADHSDPDRFFTQADMLVSLFQKQESIKVDASIFAETAGYYLNRDILDRVQSLLFSSLEASPALPDVHYQLARYYEKLRDYKEQSKAVKKAIFYLEQANPYNRNELDMFILSRNMRGEIIQKKVESAKDENERWALLTEAQSEFSKALGMYEEAKTRNILGASPGYGQIYENLGDIFYYWGDDYDTARTLYKQSLSNKWVTSDIYYKIAYSWYNEDDYKQALMSFFDASRLMPNNYNILLALSNTMFLRGDYYGAQGFYTELLRLLKKEENESIGLIPKDKLEDYSLLKMIEMTYNNLGTTYYHLSHSSAYQDYYQKALENWTHAEDYWDWITRNEDTKVRDDVSGQIFYKNMKSEIMTDEGNPDISSFIPLDSLTYISWEDQTSN